MKNRSIFKLFFLELITFGIYRIYWFIKTRREMMDQNKNIKIASPWLLLIPFLLFSAAISIFVFSTISNIYKTVTPAYATSCVNGYPYQGDQAINRYNSNSATCHETYLHPISKFQIISIISFFVGFILIMIAMALWLWSYSKAVGIITAGKLSAGLAFVIIVLVPDGLDILVIQDYFNRLNENLLPNTKADQLI